MAPLKCYVCNSIESPDCEDPIKNGLSDPEMFVECKTENNQSTKEEIGCMKLKKFLEYVNHTIIFRSCNSRFSNLCDVFVENDTDFCETCKTDGCNESTQMKPFIIFVIFSTLLSF